MILAQVRVYIISLCHIHRYQIIEVNEPAQYIKMNVWMIQKWVDEMLDWLVGLAIIWRKGNSSPHHLL